ncbi:WD40-repeat-containing domain protein [Cladochytrium replicatum]|nr:WD40-repeat-containing domain protein [Cladochytrium replicatum]
MFVSEPSNALLCPICRDVCTDPVITLVCHHSFCRTCISKSIENEPQCPLCRSKLRKEDLHPNLALAGLIQELLVYCPNREFGCNDVVRLESRSYHSSHCAFAPRSCSYAKFGCTFKGTLTSVNQHLADCAFEKIKGYIDFNEKRVAKLEAKLLEQTQELEAFRKLLDSIGTQSPKATSSAETVVSSPVRTSAMEVDEPWPNGNIRCIKIISDHKAGVTSLSYYSGMLYSGAYNGSVMVFNAQTGAPIRTIDNAHNLSVWSLAMHAPSHRFFSSGSDGTIKAWSTDPENNECQATLSEHAGKVYSLAISGDRLLSASSDRTIKIWDINTLDCVATITGHNDAINSLHLLSQTRLASASSDKTVRIWDLTTAQCTGIITGESEFLDVTADSSATGRGMLFASGYDARILAYGVGDATTEEGGWSPIGMMQGHLWEVWQVEFCGVNTLFSGSFDHTIKRWDVRRFEETAVLNGHRGFVHALTVGNSTLMSGCADKTIRVWR